MRLHPEPNLPRQAGSQVVVSSQLSCEQVEEANVQEIPWPMFHRTAFEHPQTISLEPGETAYGFKVISSVRDASGLFVSHIQPESPASRTELTVGMEVRVLSC